MTNIKTLKPVVTAKKTTYIEALNAHIEELTDENKNAACDVLMLVGITSQGAVYTVLEGDNVVEAIGLLESIKQFIVLEYLE